VVEEIMIASSNKAALEAKAVFGQVQAMATHTATKSEGCELQTPQNSLLTKNRRRFASTMMTPERSSRPFTGAIFAF
jgi:hypothetical protein